jgi:hypothetical protein
LRGFVDILQRGKTACANGMVGFDLPDYVLAFVLVETLMRAK